MKSYITIHPWKIIEESFDAELHPNSESLMSIGNGRMGQRANFPEKYSGESLQGSYIGGVYYPDKTRVGWWKNGYPEYFAKVLNSVNWIGINLKIGNKTIDLSKVKFQSFYRELDMQHGILSRSCSFKKKGITYIIDTQRFYSQNHKDQCFLRYEISSDQKAKIEIDAYLDFDVRNSDSNYDEDFWKNHQSKSGKKTSWVRATTKKTKFDVIAAMRTASPNQNKFKTKQKDRSASHVYKVKLTESDSFIFYKYVGICSSFYHEPKQLEGIANDTVKLAEKTGYEEASKAQAKAWKDIWENCNISITGDESAQQGIRFNIFQLMQTYNGEDARLNIGPKGFTGEKYGGSTYWDTEAYCLPFYMSTTSQEIAKNLLVYRHRHLRKAIENAQLLGFENGAALYPMVTMNGEECHNEWEITFEEIHRNGAIAYAIYDYIRYTGDDSYLAEYGIDVLTGIARFWVERVSYSNAERKYVILGVTGPNEYENNVNNNWYTNYIAKWCLSYTAECLSSVKAKHPDRYEELCETLTITDEETKKWKDISERIYEPVSKSGGIYLQQDGFLDKEDLTVEDLSDSDRPINQNWSWDRILRSPFIKQADVLQGIYFFEENFDQETVERNFDYYEPKTVHESSLSPCIHSILAAKLGKQDKAYEMYLRTARLDLDDYNNDTEDGCHITSMAGTWLSIVKGFAGLRIHDGKPAFTPLIPEQWDSYSFKIVFRRSLLEVTVTKTEVTINNLSDTDLEVVFNGRSRNSDAGSIITAKLKP